MFTCGPALFRAAGAAAATDPSFANTVLLYHFEETPGITDYSAAASPHHVTTNATSTLQAKFGSKSLKINGATGLTIPDSNDWTFGQLFTVETWVYVLATPSTATRVIMHQFGAGTAGNLGWWLGSVSGNLNFYYSTTGSDSPSIGAAWPAAAGAWYHIAVDRNASNVLRLYVDGAVHASATVASTFFNAPSGLGFGFSGNYNGLDGYLDEVRITQGVARYNGAFTPPTAPFPNA